MIITIIIRGGGTVQLRKIQSERILSVKAPLTRTKKITARLPLASISNHI